MSSNRAEFCWNSVDVRGDDGLLHNGRVVDAVDGGVVVEFGQTGHSNAKLVPSGCAYYSVYSEYLHWSGQYDIDLKAGPGAEGDDVEVLLRLQPHDPWKWYPGRTVHSFGLISVTLPAREVVGVVVGPRIRERLEDEAYLKDLAVVAGRFGKRFVAVPSKHVNIPADDQLIAIFNAHCRQHGYWMTATEVISNAHHVKELAVLGIFHGDNFRITRKECGPLDEVLCSLLKDGSGLLDSTSASQYPEGDLQSLHRDPTIFPQIFQCLTTIQQNKIRGVCQQWNTILTSTYIRRVVTASAPFYVAVREHDFSHNVPLYEFAASLYNCWTSHTRMLVVCGPRSRHSARLAETVRFLQRVMAEKRLPHVPVLLLAGSWRLSVDALNWVNDLCSVFLPLGSVCQQIVLKDPFVGLMCSRRPGTLIMLVNFLNQRMCSPLSSNAFWTMLNNGLNRYGADGMKLLAEWITPGSTFFDPIIPQILNTTQARDPREGVRYRGMSFSLGGDGGLKGVDVEHLTNLTLHTLLQYFKQVLDTATSARRASEPPRKKQKVDAMTPKVLFIR